jgi:hypothetical protein
LQAEQFFCWLDDNARNAVWWNRDVVILECLQVPACRFFVRQNLIGRGLDLIKVSCAHELLNQCEMWLVRWVESKASGIRLEQTGIVMLNHRRIRL